MTDVEKLNKKYDVGLFIMTMRNGIHQAMLSVRSQHENEDGGILPEPFPGTCRPTIQVRCRTGESHKTALAREFKRVFGRAHPRARKPKRLIEIETIERIVTNYGMFLHFSDIANLRISIFGDAFRFIGEDKIPEIRDAGNFDKVLGVTDNEIVAMFSEDREALKKAFATIPIEDD